jgi:hypothetical protein
LRDGIFFLIVVLVLLIESGSKIEVEDQEDASLLTTPLGREREHVAKVSCCFCCRFSPAAPPVLIPVAQGWQATRMI